MLHGTGAIALRFSMTEQRFITLEVAGFEEDISDEPVHGVFLSTEGSIYSYVEWFYDADESAFSIA
jgi:hypothetical protein